MRAEPSCIKASFCPAIASPVLATARAHRNVSYERIHFFPGLGKSRCRLGAPISRLRTVWERTFSVRGGDGVLVLVILVPPPPPLVLLAPVEPVLFFVVGEAG